MLFITPVLVKTLKWILLPVMSALMLAGCGGGSSDGTGSLSVSLTDAPIDSAQEVWVQFAGVAIRQDVDDESSWIAIEFPEPKNINLLDLQGTQRVSLLSGQELSAGTYAEFRLDVNAVEDSVFDSYIVLDDGSEVELDIPSGSQTGLKVKGEIIVPDTGEAAFTVDFDVRKSIVVQGNGEYKLKPVLRIEQDDSIGHISGTVGATLMSSCTAPVDTVDYSYSASPVIYVFNESYAQASDIPTDIEEFTSSLIRFDEGEAVYKFEVGYLPAGEYSVAFNCVLSETDVVTEETSDTNNYGAVGAVVVEPEGVVTEVHLDEPLG
jgi:hypothetical protein